MPICEITSGGVKIAEKINIPRKKYFLFFFNKFTFIILNLASVINKIGSSNEIPLVKSNNIVSFMYSEYRDSSSTLKPSLLNKFSNEMKNDQIIGISKK